MRYLSWVNLRLVLMLSFAIFMFSFANHRNSVRKVKKTNVIFAEMNPLFLTDSMVNKLLIENKEGQKTLSKEEVDLKSLENEIENHELVQKAEVYVSVDGVLKTEVVEKIPVGRIFEGVNSFYVDNKGDKMPVSEKVSIRVPLVSGVMNVENRQKVAAVLKIIEQDDFLKKNIIGVQILSNGDLLMSNRGYDFKIEFGKMINVDEKFKKYKAFYQKAEADSVLPNYKRVNLKFTKQVVGIK